MSVKTTLAAVAVGVVALFSAQAVMAQAASAPAHAEKTAAKKGDKAGEQAPAASGAKKADAAKPGDAKK